MTKSATVEKEADDLEALFDSIVSSGDERNAVAQAGVVQAGVVQTGADIKSVGTEIQQHAETQSNSATASDPVINKIGQMTRVLHDSLRELGYDKKMQKATSAIPDARARLSYVATMTQQAADRVLTATEIAQPIVGKIGDDAQRLAHEWQMLFDQKLSPEQLRELAIKTHTFLLDVPRQTRATNAQLTEIMMAQDFQDLTGQVIKKIVEVTQKMEQQLLELLVENVSLAADADAHSGLLNGPVIDAKGRTDVVTSQDQVDDLLESLGF